MGQANQDKNALRRQQREQYLQKVIGLPQASLLMEEEREKTEKTAEQKTHEIKTQKKIFSQEAEKLGVFSNDVSNSVRVSKDCNKMLDDARELIK